MTNFVSHGRQQNPHPQYLLETRITPFEDRAQIFKLFAYETYSSVYGANKQGIEDPSALIRDGWYYANVNGEKINWSFYDGLAYPSVSLQDLSGYVIMTLDSISSLPSIVVDTFPTGTGDAVASTAHTRRTYTITSPGSITIGTKYLFYFGNDPAANPELPRIALTLSSVLGDNNSAELVRTCSLTTSSGAATNSVKLTAQVLAIYAANYKHELVLRIRKVTEAQLTVISGQISGLNSTVNSLSGDVTTLSGDLSTLTTTVNNLSSTVATQGTTITNLSNTVSSQGTAITNLTTQVNTNTSDIASLSSSISTTNTNLSNLTTTVNTLSSDVSNLTTQVNTNTNDITVLQSQIGSIVPRLEARVLTNTEATDKSLVLSNIPSDPTKVLLIPQGGPAQRIDVDFSVVGDTLSWSGLGLDGFLDEGEYILIQY